MAAIPHITTTSLALRAGIPPEAVDQVFAEIRKAIEEGVEVRIPGFGAFRPAQRSTVPVRTPLIRGGEPVPRSGGRTLRFRPARTLLNAWKELK